VSGDELNTKVSLSERFFSSVMTVAPRRNCGEAIQSVKGSLLTLPPRK
jgi:hypothetical protein